MTSNPYQSSTPAHDGLTDARTKIFGPAMALLGLATLTLILELWVGFTLVVDAVRFVQHYGFVSGLLQAAPFILAFGAVFSAHLAVLIGARKMMTLRSYRFAKTAAILSMIPVLTPAYLLAIPFGIWAFVTLRDRNVRDAFSTTAT